MDDGHSNGEHGVKAEQVSVLSFTYNHETHQVAIGGQPMPLSLAMMICDEGKRVLEEQRRTAAALALRQHIEQQALNARVAAAVSKVR